jgi:hypothetical protein
VRFVDRKTVLAGKGSLPPRQEPARPCPLRAVLQQNDCTTGGSGGNEDRTEVSENKVYTKSLTPPGILI